MSSPNAINDIKSLLNIFSGKKYYICACKIEALISPDISHSLREFQPIGGFYLINESLKSESNPNPKSL